MLISRDVDKAEVLAVSKDYRNSVLTKEFGVASFTILVWDHIITFSEEVELIWKGKKGPVIYLFFLNRYLIPLSFIVNLWAYSGTGLTEQSCRHFVRFEGAMTLIGISTVALMMFFRIRALYRSSSVVVRALVQGIVIVILLTFIGMNSWLLNYGAPVSHPRFSFVKSCTMIFENVHPVASSSTAWLPLLYDTVVVALTLYRTAPALYSKTVGQSFRILLQEGLLYYSVICTITLALTISIVKADRSVRNLPAQLELCLTVTMMSRITLHLKRFGNRDTVEHLDATRRHIPQPILPSAACPHPPPWPSRGISRLKALVPRVAHPLGWSTSARAPSITAPECNSLEMEALHKLSDEELAYSRGGA